MEIKVKELSSNQVEMVITLAWEEIEKDYSIFSKKFIKKVELQGFRKGKVPASLVERHYGGQMEFDFVNDKFSDYYVKALEEKELNPVGQPDLTDLDFKKSSPLIMTVKFDVMPAWEMPEYKGVEIEKPSFSITETDVKEYIKNLQDNMAEVKPIEGGAEKGHFVIADVEQLDEAKKEVVNETKNNKIVLGEAPFTGAAEKALLGIKAGETREITIPAEDDKEIMLNFRIAATAVEEHILPEVNDEFAKSVDAELTSVEDLKKKLKGELKSYWEKQADTRIEENIADYFIEKLSDVKLPESVVEEQAKTIVEDMKKRYPSAEEVNEADMVKTYMETAEKSLKWQLVKNKIVEENKLEVKQEDIDAKIEDMLKDVDENMRSAYAGYYKSAEAQNHLRGDAMNDMILVFLKKELSLKTKKISRKERIEEMGQ